MATNTGPVQPMGGVETGMISPVKVKLSPNEAHAVALASKWMENPDKPRWEDDGSVRYLYGATLPTLVCAPLQICAIRLQPGEEVEGIDSGDSVRWKFSPSVVGNPAGKITEVLVKVTDAALETSIRITTDRRAYTIRLRSTQKEWMPALSFDYPDQVESEWAAYAAARTKKVTSTTLPTGQTFDELDFGFKLSGDKPRWLPLRVYSDGTKTYIQFPPSMASGESPALLSMDNGEEQLVNYRPLGDRYVVDKVLDRAELISGVGKHAERVTITRLRKR
ncbi:P-type conjugative transfer protein TrbG [Xanthomonas perforans]|uniref:P-type conjugative transfer protein TrbG n=1 Tax=Xanthomonas perforans TaxID=442694 RepID=UPI002358D59C|nr:P-type conjugative transfer protein TrbG [Xanthomonas perforans]MDC9654345.1 P-type conjugative transfer protein TrbG [Xanthomonas perforans]MEB2158974.1 P-type conjugative transfer protein TrbG [Xanthomonas campestris pv. campestris]